MAKKVRHISLVPGATEKVCPRCKVLKPRSEYHACKAKADGMVTYCKPCQAIIYKAHILSHQHELEFRKRLSAIDRRCHRKRTYGLTDEEHAAMVAAQNNCCAICGNGETYIHPRNNKLRELSVDHDHDTMVIRGLLCNNCNQGLGKFKEDPALLEAAAAYLRHHANRSR